MDEAEEAAPEAREGAKTPEMPADAPKEEAAPPLHPELAEFDVPERVLLLIGGLPEVQEYVVDLHKTIRSFRNATAALQQVMALRSLIPLERLAKYLQIIKSI